MSLTLKPPRPVTDAELLEFARRNPGFQFERSATGELIVTPTGSEAGRRTLQLAFQIEAWNRTRLLGVVFDSSTGFRMPDGSLLSPDASWVRRDRWEALSIEQRAGFAPLCPDAVFEIASKTVSLAELRAKMRVYLANGAQLAILIDPEGRSVEVHEPGQELQTSKNRAAVSLDRLLPGFVLELGPLFA